MPTQRNILQPGSSFYKKAYLAVTGALFVFFVGSVPFVTFQNMAVLNANINLTKKKSDFVLVPHRTFKAERL